MAGLAGSVKPAGKVIVTLSPAGSWPEEVVVKIAVQLERACAVTLTAVKLTPVTAAPVPNTGSVAVAAVVFSDVQTE